MGETGAKLTKICRTCDKEKSLNQFYKSTAKTKDGLRHECKSCWNESSLDYYFRNKETIAENGWFGLLAVIVAFVFAPIILGLATVFMSYYMYYMIAVLDFFIGG